VSLWKAPEAGSIENKACVQALGVSLQRCRSWQAVVCLLGQTVLAVVVIVGARQ
jgi:hypothetical protein